jgi:ribonuclease HII
MPPDTRAMRGVDDSKLLTARARERLARLIRARALALGVGAASSREIDRINIFQASVLAMRRALSRLAVRPDHVLVDGRQLRTLGTPHIGVIDGDDRCYNIACASIIAKVTRDRLMVSLARRHPSYAWERNCGYATRSHIAGLAEHGPSAHHRRSFLVKALQVDDQIPLDLEREDGGAEAYVTLAPVISSGESGIGVPPA